MLCIGGGGGAVGGGGDAGSGSAGAGTSCPPWPDGATASGGRSLGRHQEHLQKEVEFYLWGWSLRSCTGLGLPKDMTLGPRAF